MSNYYPTEKKRKIEKLQEQLEKLEEEVLEDQLEGWLIAQPKSPAAYIFLGDPCSVSGPFKTREEAIKLAKATNVTGWRIMPVFKEPLYRCHSSDLEDRVEFTKKEFTSKNNN